MDPINTFIISNKALFRFIFAPQISVWAESEPFDVPWWRVFEKGKNVGVIEYLDSPLLHNQTPAGSIFLD